MTVAMTPEEFTIDTLGRLSRLETHGHQVLSVYLDLDPSRFPTPATRVVQLELLLDQARARGSDEQRDGIEDSAARVRALLEAAPPITRGAHGLAAFASAEADVLASVYLPTSVQPIAVLDTVPWLEPLAGLLAPDAWGVAVVSRSSARLFRGGPHGLIQFAAIHDDVHGKHAQGGWSQARFQRGIEEEVAVHIRGVADRLLQAHRRLRFEHVVLVASSELRPVLERSLHSELSDVLAGTVDADLERAPIEEVADVLAPVFERAERDRERLLVRRVDQALATGGAAAAGLDEVLSTLEQQRVETLLVPPHSNLAAGRCPSCGRLAATSGGRCPLDGETLEWVDAVEHAVEEAGRQSAQVLVVRHEAEWFRAHGELAALLRW